MKIKTRLVANLIINTGLMVFLVILLMFYSSEITKELEKQKFAHQLVRQTTDLVTIGEEYIVYRYPRMTEQWNSSSISIKKLLKNMEASDIINNISKNLNRLDDSFFRLRKIYEKSGGNTLPKGWVLLEDDLSSKMRIISRDMIASSLKLSENVTNRVNIIQGKRDIAIFVVLFLIIALTIMFSYRTLKRITEPLSALVRDANAIKDGNLEHKITGIESTKNILRDEIGELSISFSSMTDKLLNSIVNLKAEVSERAKVEKLLQKAHDNLEQQVNERTLELSRANEALSSDITERKQVEEELQTKQKELDLIYNSTPDLIALFEVEDYNRYRMVSFNDAYWTQIQKMDPNIAKERLKGIELSDIGSLLGIPEQLDYIEKYNNVRKSKKTTSTIEKIPTLSGDKYLGTLVSPILDDNKECTHILYSSHDITKLKQTEESLLETQRLLVDAQRMAKLGSWEYDLLTNKITWSKEVYSIFGLDESYVPSLVGLAEWIHPDDLWVIAPETIEKNSKAGIQEMEYRIIDQNTKEIKYVIDRGETLKNAEGEPIKNFGSFQDITGRKQVEEQIIASLKEKETLLQEIHHRVKNNMAVISSLLRLQSNKMNDEKLTEALMDSRNRVQTMSIIHETLYQSDNLSSINMETYLSKLSRSVAQNYRINNKVNQKIEAEDNILVGAKQASPLGLIVNELITNSFKHAFPDNREGEIKISLQKTEDQIELEYADDGIGIPEDFNWKNTKSMGLNLVKILAENQLDGSIDMENKNGTKFIIKFNIES